MDNVWFFAIGWGVALALGVIPILAHLQLTGRVRFDGDPLDEEGYPGRLIIGCGDKRCHVHEVIFGGAAAFAPGYVYAAIGYNLGGAHTILGSFFYGYAAARAMLVFVSLTKLAWIILKDLRWIHSHPESTIVLRAHQHGCGYVTASGILFPLYWLQKLTHWKWIEETRDVDTLVSTIASLPILFVAGYVIRLIARADFTAELADVDYHEGNH